jgi:protein-S-isoprenylcysteine O-methyltransferase Ste14
MALADSFEHHGNWLFKRRSWIPLLLFVPAIATIWLKPVEWFPFSLISWSLACLLVSLTGLGIRSWAIGHTPKGTSGRNTKQGQIAEKLNTTGVYSLVRHPLYLGNFLMWLGVVLYVGDLSLVIFAVFFFWIYYERIMYAEEAFIHRKFGKDFEVWSTGTPSFFPRCKGYRKPELGFSLKNVLKREYTGFTLTILSFSFVNMMKYWSYFGKPDMDPLWIFLLPFSLMLYFVLRTLKKRTKWLNVEGR